MIYARYSAFLHFLSILGDGLYSIVLLFAMVATRYSPTLSAEPFVGRLRVSDASALAGLEAT